MIACGRPRLEPRDEIDVLARLLERVADLHSGDRGALR